MMMMIIWGEHSGGKEKSKERTECSTVGSTGCRVWTNAWSVGDSTTETPPGCLFHKVFWLKKNQIKIDISEKAKKKEEINGTNSVWNYGNKMKR